MDDKLSFRNLIISLSYAFDLGEGQSPGHSIRCCWIGMHFAPFLKLSTQEQYDLYYTLLLKDAGCSSNAARLCEIYGTDDRLIKSDFKKIDSQKKSELAKFILEYSAINSSMYKKFSHILKIIGEGKKLVDELVLARCKKGADFARQLHLGETVAKAIFSLDEHYNGRGRPQGLVGNAIPLGSRISLLAQTIDIFYQMGSIQSCLKCIHERSGTWFDPELVRIFEKIASDQRFWDGLSSPIIDMLIEKFEPNDKNILLPDELLNEIAALFAQIIDAKSPFTEGHSQRVAEYSASLGSLMHIKNITPLYQAALLHDAGKLGVSNMILDKPDKLNQEEWRSIKKLPKMTHELLSRVFSSDHLAFIAAAHHERMDGRGYFLGLKGEQIPLETRIITLCDIFDALTSDRSYRTGIPLNDALNMMRKMCGTVLDSDCFDALHALCGSSPELIDITARESFFPKRAAKRIKYSIFPMHH